MPQFTIPIDLEDPVIRKVLWAAMCAMVEDIHAPQDNLSEAEWLMAGRVFAVLNALADRENPEC